MVAADCLTLFGAMASETTWLTHILYMTTDCHYVVVRLSHLSAAPQCDDISLSLASKRYQCLHRSRQVVILAVPPCQPSRVTPWEHLFACAECTGRYIGICHACLFASVWVRAHAIGISRMSRSKAVGTSGTRWRLSPLAWRQFLL